MKKPEHPMAGGGGMSAVAMAVTLGIAPVTAIGAVAGTVIGGALGMAGLVSGIGTGLMVGAVIPVGLGITASVGLIAMTWASYGVDMIKYKRHTSKASKPQRNIPARSPKKSKLGKKLSAIFSIKSPKAKKPQADQTQKPKPKGPKHP